jgi:hypothetical protein
MFAGQAGDCCPDGWTCQRLTGSIQSTCARTCPSAPQVAPDIIFVTPVLPAFFQNPKPVSQPKSGPSCVRTKVFRVLPCRGRQCYKSQTLNTLKVLNFESNPFFWKSPMWWLCMHRSASARIVHSPGHGQPHSGLPEPQVHARLLSQRGGAGCRSQAHAPGRLCSYSCCTGTRHHWCR